MEKTYKERCEYFDNLYNNIIKRDRTSTEHANNTKYISGKKLIEEFESTPIKNIENNVKSELDKFD